MLIWLEYRSNSVLVIPPGLTHGIEYPPLSTISRTSTNGAEIEEHSIIFAESRNKRDDTGMTIEVSCQENVAKQEEQSDTNNVQIDTLTENSNNSSIATIRNRWLSMIKIIRKSAALFIPWASDACGIVLEGRLQFFHIWMLYAFAQLYDIPRRWFYQREEEKHAEMTQLGPAIINQHIGVASSNQKACECISGHKAGGATNDGSDENTPRRIVVLGDSLAIGIGSVDQFENYRPLYFRAENVAEFETGNDEPGPVFPRVFASALAKYGKKPVHWRSAGVDGGDTKDINEYCLGVIEEEVEKGRPPDIVLLIVGLNDLKYFCGNPLKHGGPHDFQSALTKLICDIRKISPKTKVVLPGLRIFHQYSLGFPLTFFLDRVLGFWDSQKDLVASRFPDSEVLYVGVSPDEVKHWYTTDMSEYGIETDTGPDGKPNMSLIAADGLHPNARCYAHWAVTVAEKVANCIPVDLSLQLHQQTLSAHVRGGNLRLS